MEKKFSGIDQSIRVDPLLTQKFNLLSVSQYDSEPALLLEVIQKLSLAPDLETIMFIVRKAARNLTGADGASFVLLENNQCYYADEDAISPLWKGKRFPLETCVSGWVMMHHQSTVIEDVYMDPRIPTDAYRPTFVKSMAMVPIRTASPIGAIGTYWAEKYHPTKEQINLLKILADATSVSMENILLQSQVEQGAKVNSAHVAVTKALMDTNKKLKQVLKELNLRNKEMLLVKELSSALQSCIYLEEAYKLIAQYAAKLLPDVEGIFYLMHPSRNYLEAMFSWKKPLPVEKIIKPEECLGLRRGSIYKVDDVNEHLTCTHFKSKKLSPYVCIPLLAQSDILGLLCLKWKNYNSKNTDAQLKISNQYLLGCTLAEQIALGLANVKLRETLRSQSFTDPLTSLYNRRYLEESLQRELNRCLRKSAPIALFMIDIDHFKLFNDQFGHDAGDLVLQTLAKIVQQFVRKEDIPCRFGGDEFIIALPEVELPTAIERAALLHREINKTQLQHGKHRLAKITISIGLAIFPMHGDNMKNLIKAADTALYHAKHAGRNQTIIANRTN